MAFMLSSMFHAVKERHRLNTARYSLDQTEPSDSQGTNMASTLASLTSASVAAPPVFAGSSKSTPPPPPPPPPPMLNRDSWEQRPVQQQQHQQQQQQQHQVGHIPDKIELAQINENLSEQLEWQQQQQRHRAQMDHSQAGYGASGTGAYC
ncbi:hypothetical protein BGX26_005311 [Mortierella sp. AD094]|nr:hypothetical protein BGX26_005311 [Mortierella sp. AD094]